MHALWEILFFEKVLSKEVHKAARSGKAVWLNSVGSWAGMRKLRRPQKRKQGRLKDENGQLASSENRADTMVSYLETVQWRVRPATLQ